MVRDRATGSLIGLFILFMIACAVAQEETPQLNTDEINNKINNAHKLYRQAKFEDAVISTSSLLAGQDLTTEQESEALLVLAMSEANRGQDKEAKTYLERLADIDPGVDLNPDEYPPQMMRIWYAVEQNIPEEKRKTPVGQRSVAVLPFDNTSISKDQKDLDPLSKGLASMMIQDIVKTGQLKVVERDRINFLVDELKLQQSDLSDKATAVRMGKLVGAQTLLMGSFMKIDKNNIVLLGRLVSVETSEILRAEEVRGEPEDIFDLQKELVFKILDELKVKVDSETEEQINKGRDSKYDALYHYSLGLALEDKRQYKEAYAQYQKALEIAPGYAEAARKKDRLEPLALKG